MDVTSAYLTLPFATGFSTRIALGAINQIMRAVERALKINEEPERDFRGTQPRIAQATGPAVGTPS